MGSRTRALLVVAAAACLAVPIGPATASPTEPERLLVELRPGAAEAAIRPTLTALRLTTERTIPQLGVVVVRASRLGLGPALSVLRAHPAVERVEPEITVSAVDTNPNDDHWPGQWGLRQTGFAKAWDVERGSAATVVAVVDTGVERNHPDLRDAVLDGYDVLDGDASPSDENGHGTAVAGIVAARANNHRGIAGACWACRVLPVRALGRDGTGSSSAIADGIVWAVDHGASVVNLSLGASQPSLAIDAAVKYAARHDVVVVAAAGNGGSTKRFYPAATEGVVAVAATDESDRLYSWSNRGDWVELTAPGCNTAPWRNATYATFCGTSSAAPLVAGLAALVRSAQPRLTARETERQLGRGRLDAARAFPRSQQRAPASAPPQRRTSSSRPRLLSSMRKVAAAARS